MQSIFLLSSRGSQATVAIRISQILRNFQQIWDFLEDGLPHQCAHRFAMTGFLPI